MSEGVLLQCACVHCVSLRGLVACPKILICPVFRYLFSKLRTPLSMPIRIKKCPVPLSLGSMGYSPGAGTRVSSGRLLSFLPSGTVRVRSRRLAFP